MNQLEFGSGEANGDNGSAYQQRCCSSFYLSCRQFVLLLAKNFLLQVCTAYVRLSLSQSCYGFAPGNLNITRAPVFVFSFVDPLARRTSCSLPRCQLWSWFFSGEFRFVASEAERDRTLREMSRTGVNLSGVYKCV